MQTRSTSKERTVEYLEKFNRERTLQSLLSQEAPVILDVGANDGSSARDFKRMWPGATIHCFEPQTECLEGLEATRDRYPRGEVVVNLSAVGDEPSESETFYSHDITSAQSGFYRINPESVDSLDRKRALEEGGESLEAYKGTLNRERSVPVVRLDQYLNSNGIDRVSLLKIDTQGFEPQVLRGLGDRLADIDVVVSELMFFDFYERQLSFSDVERYLLPAGFRLFDISFVSKNPMTLRTDWVDVIYVNDRVRGTTA